MWTSSPEPQRLNLKLVPAAGRSQARKASPLVELRALASGAPDIAGKIRQIAFCLDADADQLEKVAARKALSGKGAGARAFIADVFASPR